MATRGKLNAQSFNRRSTLWHTEYYDDADGEMRVRWCNTSDVLAIPYDNPIPGYRNGTINTLRLWKAQATDVFDLEDFNAGDYAAAVTNKNSAENISMVLYPNDKSESGKSSSAPAALPCFASLQDYCSPLDKVMAPISNFYGENCFQLNYYPPNGWCC